MLASFTSQADTLSPPPPSSEIRTCCANPGAGWGCVLWGFRGSSAAPAPRQVWSFRVTASWRVGYLSPPFRWSSALTRRPGPRPLGWQPQKEAPGASPLCRQVILLLRRGCVAFKKILFVLYAPRLAVFPRRIGLHRRAPVPGPPGAVPPPPPRSPYLHGPPASAHTPRAPTGSPLAGAAPLTRGSMSNPVSFLARSRPGLDPCRPVGGPV